MHEVIRLGGYEGAEVPADDAVPLRPVQLVEVFLDQRRDVLRQTIQTTNKRGTPARDEITP